MPRVTIPGVGDVQFPNNLSRDEIMRQAEAMQAKASQPILDPKDLPMGELIKGGAARGVESLKGTAFDLIPALGASLFGNDKYAKGQVEEYKQRMLNIEQEYPTAYQSFKDINSVGQAFDYGAETLGQVAPDVVSFMLGAGVGNVGGRYAARKGLERALEEHGAEYATRKGLTKEAEAAYVSRLKDRATEGVLQKQALEYGAEVGLKTGLWGSSLALNVPDTFNQIYQETGSLNPGLALTIGPLVAALDVITPERFIRQISPAGKQIIANELLQKSDLVPLTWKKEFGKEVLKNAGMEGLTEGAQQALQNYGSELAGSKNKLFSQQSIDSILDASIRGSIGGTLFGAPGAGFEANRSKQARQTLIDKQQADQQRQQQVQANQQLLYPTQLAEQIGGAEPSATVGGAPIQAGPQAQVDLPIPTATVGQAPIQAGEQAQFGLNMQEQQLISLLDQYQKQQDIQVKNKQATTENIRQGKLDSTPVQNAVVETMKATTEPIKTTTPETTHILDAEKLKAVGLKENAGIFKRLVDKDLSNSTDIVAAKQVLQEALQNRNFAPELKTALNDIINKGVEYGQTINTVGGTDRTRDEISNRPAESGVAQGLGESQGVSVDNTGRPVTPTTTGEESQPGALTAAVGQAPINVGQQATFTPSTPPEQIATGVPSNVTTTPAQTAVTPEVPVEANEADRAAIEKQKQKQKPSKEETEGTQVWQGYWTIPAKEFTSTGVFSYNGFYDQDISNIEDQIKVRFELLQNAKEDPSQLKNLTASEIKDFYAQRDAARIYFGKMKRIVDNLINIGYDLAYKTPVFKPTTETTVEARFFEGLNAKNASLATAWVRKNLSKETNLILDNIFRIYKRAASEHSKKNFINSLQDAFSGKKEPRLDRDSTIKGYYDAQAADIARAQQKKENQRPFHYEQIMGQRIKVFDIIKDAIYNLSQGLHPRIIESLQQGDLKSALSLLTANEDAFIAKIANRFFKIASNTKIRVEPNLTSIEGKKVPGYYDPRNNTIYLDAVEGMNTHVLMHEVSHSVISHELDNPNSQLARHLKQIFDDVKDSLDTAYGAENVQEFAAEALANPEFRAKLQGINPQGRAISAWDKFSRAVTNFLRKIVGMSPKPLESALDEVDRIIDTLISPAPDYRNSGALHAPANAKSPEIFTGINKFVNATPLLGTETKIAIASGLETSTQLTKSIVLSFLPTYAVGELSKDILPNSMDFDKAILARDAFRAKLSEQLEAIIDEAKEAIKTRPEQRPTFNTVVNQSTIHEVDPTKNESEYTDADSITEYRRIKAEYNKLSPQWKKLYVSMRDANKQIFEELKDSIRARIDATDLDNPTKERLKKDILLELSKKGLIDPYFALGREGDKWLAFNYITKDGTPDRAQEAFKTDYERKLRMEQLQKLGVTEIEPYSQISDINYRRAPSGSFANQVLRLLEANRPQDSEAAKKFDTAIDEMMRLFVTTLPETAAAKAFLKRKNTTGYMEDTIGVFERRGRNMIRQISNMKYNPQITDVVDKMQEHVNKVGRGAVPELNADGTQKIGLDGNPVFKPARDNSLELSYLQEYEKRLPYTLNPKTNDIGATLTTGAFIYTLGWNISSAIVNAANIPMIVAPYLNGQYPGANISRTIANSTKIYAQSGRTKEIEILGSGGRKRTMTVGLSLDNYDPNSEIGKRYAPLLKAMHEQGQIRRSQLYEMLQGDTRSGFLQRVAASAGWFMHEGERMNREITAISAYDLEMQKLASDIASGKLTKEQAELKAANNAVAITQYTNGGISSAQTPRIAQSALGKIFFMYKKYGASMYFLLLHTTSKIFKENLSPAERKAAWKQVGGIMGMSALMAGVGGVPMFGMLSLIYSMFSDDDDDDLDTVTRKYMGDFMYKGLPEYMTNISLASRISLSDLIIRDTKGGTHASTFAEQMMETVGGPVYGVYGRISRGYSKMQEGNFERGLEDMLPSAISNLLKAGRYGMDGTTTLRGDPITGDVNAWNIGAQAFGFAPADYTKQIEINARLKGIDKTVNQKASKLRSKWNMARTVGDVEAMNEAKDELIELGDKHPGLGINAGTITSDLEKSKKQFDRATKEMVNGVRYSKKMLKELQANAAEYE
jgi:hypothetical protein